MPYYWTCPYCGAHLDHGERCDCQNNTWTRERKFETMLDKVKITITREDGSPLFPRDPEPMTAFLTDDDQFLVIKKDGGGVETRTVYVSGLLELTLIELEKLDAATQKAICESNGVKVH